MPLRLFEYAYSRRPVFLIAPEGQATGFIDKTRCGIWIEPGDKVAITSKLRDFLDGVMSGSYTHDPDLTVLNRFERKHLTGKLAQLFDKLIGASVSE